MPHFRFTTSGLAGICHIDLPHDTELIDTFDCETTTRTRYKLNHIKPATKGLLCANKVSLRTDICGLLCFQFMVKTDEGATCYIEFYVRIIKESAAVYNLHNKSHNPRKKKLKTNTNCFVL